MVTNLTGQELMSYSGQGDSGGLCAGGTTLQYDSFYNYYPTYYPSYHYVESRSKIEQAFKVVGKLLERKLIEKELTVKEFMKIVNDIAEVL
jgi:hypothetical protein